MLMKLSRDFYQPVVDYPNEDKFALLILMTMWRTLGLISSNNWTLFKTFYAAISEQNFQH